MAPPSFIYVMKDLRKVVPPSREILRGIWLSFYYGAKIGVLGANGAGKSSLLRIMAGVDTDFQGEAWAAEGTRIGFLPQEPQLDPSLDVRGNVELAVKAQRALLQEFQDISMAFAEPMSDARWTSCWRARRACRSRSTRTTSGISTTRSRSRWTRCACRRRTPTSASCQAASGAACACAGCCWRSRTSCCSTSRRTTSTPRASRGSSATCMISREPSSRSPTIDISSTTSPAGSSSSIAATGFRTRATTRRGSSRRSRASPPRRKTESARQRTLQRELEWVRLAPRARQAKNKARVQKYEEMVAAETAEKIMQHEIVIPPPPRLGNDVVTAKDFKKAFGDKLLIDGLDLRAPARRHRRHHRTERRRKDDAVQDDRRSGRAGCRHAKVGETVQIAYSDQSRTLNGEVRAWQEISGGQELIMVGKKELNSRAYLSSFNFRGTDQQKKVGTLSGGERNRLHLAKTLMSGGNLLLLDEPTNDLDVDTLRALEDALIDFTGCAVVISHDRWFLDRIATHILAFEGNSEVVWHEGNYQSYIEDLRSGRAPTPTSRTAWRTRSSFERSTLARIAFPLRGRAVWRAVVVGMLAVVSASARAQTSTTSDSTSTLAGVYTGDQAKRGKEAYLTFCNSSATFRRRATRSPNAGPEAILDLFTYIYETMPDNNPRSVSETDNADIIGYLLQVTGMPVGSRELPVVADSLKAIRIEMMKKEDALRIPVPAE